MAAKNDVSGREKGGESGAGEEIQRWTAGRKAAIVLDRDRSTNHTPQSPRDCSSAFHRSGSHRSRSAPLACGTLVDACVRERWGSTP